MLTNLNLIRGQSAHYRPRQGDEEGRSKYWFRTIS